MSYLRFTPEEFRAIRRACDSVELSDDFFVFFKYFLVESLSGMLPFLAIRIARFRRPQLDLLYGFIRRQKASEVKSRGQTRSGEVECGLTSEELQDIRRASGPFFLHDGSLSSFQDYLVYNLGKTRPGLAAKLARLLPRQTQGFTTGQTKEAGGTLKNQLPHLVQRSRDFSMKTRAKNKNNYVDALENDHLYAVLTKRGRIQILVQPTVKQLRNVARGGGASLVRWTTACLMPVRS
jgi:hypothetical protein